MQHLQGNAIQAGHVQNPLASKVQALA